jgi:hypothetical protein
MNSPATKQDKSHSKTNPARLVYFLVLPGYFANVNRSVQFNNGVIFVVI